MSTVWLSRIRTMSIQTGPCDDLKHLSSRKGQYRLQTVYTHFRPPFKNISDRFQNSSETDQRVNRLVYPIKSLITSVPSLRLLPRQTLHEVSLGPYWPITFLSVVVYLVILVVNVKCLSPSWNSCMTVIWKSLHNIFILPDYSLQIFFICLSPHTDHKWMFEFFF